MMPVDGKAIKAAEQPEIPLDEWIVPNDLPQKYWYYEVGSYNDIPHCRAELDIIQQLGMK